MYEFQSSLPDKDTVWQDMYKLAESEKQFTKYQVTFLLWFYAYTSESSEAKTFLSKYRTHKKDLNLYLKQMTSHLTAKINAVGNAESEHSVRANLALVRDEDIISSSIKPYELFIIWLDESFIFARSHLDLIDIETIKHYETQMQDYYETKVITNANFKDINLNTEFHNIFQFNSELGVNVQASLLSELTQNLISMIANKLVDTGVYDLNEAGPILIGEIYRTTPSKLRPADTKSVPQSEYFKVEKALSDAYLPMNTIHESMDYVIQVFDQHKTLIARNTIKHLRTSGLLEQASETDLTWRPDIQSMTFHNQRHGIPSNVHKDDIVFVIYTDGSGSAFYAANEVSWNCIAAYLVVKRHDYALF